MHFSNETEKRKLSQFPNPTQRSLQSRNVTSRNAVLVTTTLLILQFTNSHSENFTLERLTLTKLHWEKTHDSYSCPRASFVKSIFSNVWFSNTLMIFYIVVAGIFARVTFIKLSTASISDLSVKTQNHSCLFLNAENTLSTSALRESSQITDTTLLRVVKTDWNQFSLTLYLPECTICHGISLDHNCKSWSNNLS